MPSAERRPSRRASELASTISWLTSGATSARVERLLEVVRRTGTARRRPAGRRPADLTSAGTLGFCSMFASERRGQARDQDRADQRGAERRARGWSSCSARRRPRSSARRGRPTRRRCRAARRARRPRAPMQQQRHGDDLGSRVGVDQGRQQRPCRAPMASSPRRHDAPRGGVRGEPRDADARWPAARRDSGRSRTPVSSADSPSTTDRKSGITKNSARLDEELEEEQRQAAVELRGCGASTGGRAARRRCAPAAPPTGRTARSPARRRAAAR